MMRRFLVCLATVLAVIGGMTARSNDNLGTLAGEDARQETARVQLREQKSQQREQKAQQRETTRTKQETAKAQQKDKKAG